MTEQEALDNFVFEVKELNDGILTSYEKGIIQVLQNALNELQIYRETIKNIDIKKLNEVNKGE